MKPLPGFVFEVNWDRDFLAAGVFFFLAPI
jgi:hypothetical protein